MIKLKQFRAELLEHFQRATVEEYADRLRAQGFVVEVEPEEWTHQSSVVDIECIVMPACDSLELGSAALCNELALAA